MSGKLDELITKDETALDKIYSKATMMSDKEIVVYSSTENT